MGKKRTIWDDIRGDDTFKVITHGVLIDPLTNGIKFINNIGSSGRKFIDTTANFFSGDGLYIVLAIGGGFVLIYGVSTINSMMRNK